ncbi:MAG: hypothetical protein AB1644_09975 [Candidatus Zixiibacteriota bacterium]
MGLRFPEQKNAGCFFITTVFRDHQPYGSLVGVYEFLAESLRFCSRKYHAMISGYVFMPSHVHLLLFIDGKHLGDYMRDFKKFISQKTIKDLGVSDSQIWMPRYDRVVIYTERVFLQKLGYIHSNPVKATLAETPEQWKWSSAATYAGLESGSIDIWKDWSD